MSEQWIIRAAAWVIGGAGLIACAETGRDYYHPIAEADYPVAEGPGEDPVTGEEREAAARISAIIEAHLRRRDSPPIRDAHPKATGCVRAQFNVRSDLQPELRHGIFAIPRTYEGIIRFSNSNEDPSRSDAEGDGRGMAIKIYGFSQETLMKDALDRPSQDFIMISHPTFIVSNPDDYQRLVGYVNSDNWLTKIFEPMLSLSSIGWTGVMNAIETTSKKIDNPLNTRYWSMVPYQLGIGEGAVAVKYSAASCDVEPAVMSTIKDNDFLQDAMRSTLSAGPACMKFMIQPRTSEAMSVEDSRYEWLESEAPFYEVATITIPQQDFRADACDQLSYSPWHALPDHRPLGAVNRLRKVIYERISAVRRNAVSTPSSPN